MHLLDSETLRIALIALVTMALARLVLPFIPVVGPRLAGLI